MFIVSTEVSLFCKTDILIGLSDTNNILDNDFFYLSQRFVIRQPKPDMKSMCCEGKVFINNPKKKRIYIFEDKKITRYLTMLTRTDIKQS